MTQRKQATVKQGKSTLTLISTIDTKRNVERRAEEKAPITIVRKLTL